MKTKDLVLTAMLTAVLSVLSIIQIPMPSGVPITLQTFAVALCGYVLGSKYGTISTFLYVLIGTVGVPVFAGMTAGFSVLFGMTGGFLFGFIPMAFLAGLGIRSKAKWMPILLGLAGLAVCHLLGTLQFSLVTGTGLGASFLMVSVPYLVKDVLSVVGAAVVAIAIRKGLANANLMNYGPAV
ncbi:MAG: biotin transporter BioY [Lachnospiraceae bacterium]|jgi:biotin transport system substrate-specific component|nr:biotin transporter BioY [Lachnospiraceae bacterium]